MKTLVEVNRSYAKGVIGVVPGRREALVWFVDMNAPMGRLTRRYMEKARRKEEKRLAHKR
jgi:hypothetical protein